MAGLVNYSVMVRILAANGAAPVLRTIAADVLGLGNKVDAIGAKFGKWRLALAGVGVGVAGVGAVAVTAAAKIALMGDQIVRVQQQLKGIGVSGADVQRMTAAAIGTQRAYPTLKTSEALTLERKLYSVFASPKDVLAAQGTAGLAEAILDNLGIGGPAGIAQLYKSAELAGAVTRTAGGLQILDPAAASAAMTNLVKVLYAGGGLVTPAQIFQFTRMAGPAAKLMGETYWQTMGEAVQQMQARGGRGASLFYAQMTGGRIGRPSIEAMTQLGLLGQGGFGWFPGSSQGYIRPGGVTGYGTLMNQGMFAWVEQVLVPDLVRHGATTLNQQLALVNQIFSNQTTRALVQSMIQNPASYQREARMLGDMPSLQAIYALQMQSLSASLTGLKNSLDSLLQVAGAPAVQDFARFVREVTGVVGDMEKWSYANPQVSRDIIEGLGGVGLAMVGLGSGAALMAMISLAGPGGILLALPGAIIALTNAFEIFDKKLRQLFPWAFPAPGQGIMGPGGQLKYPVQFLPQHIKPLANLAGAENAAAAMYGISPSFYRQLIFAESHNKAGALSTAGAIGYAQLMPGTAKMLGINPFDPAQNVMGGARYFSGLLKMFGGNYAEAIAAYNAGPGAVQAAIKGHGALWAQYLPAETQSYLAQLLPFAPTARKAAIPQVAQTTGNSDKPQPVIVVNAPDVASALTHGIAGGMSNNPAGPITFNPNRGYTAPGQGAMPSVLIR